MIRNNASKSRKVLLVELNEITWRLVDPLCNEGKLPGFSEFIEEGVRGTAVAVEDPPDLDPWISWTTLYTGRPQSEHGVKFLEQPPETVTGPRFWELAADAGKSLGIYGSIMSWPPRQDIHGFWVPATFSPSCETFPKALEPIQHLNLAHTRAHDPTAEKQGGTKLSQAWRLLKLGLRFSTLARAASFLFRTKLRPHRKWEKVSLQPIVNLDFFEKLYKTHRPDVATFHSNHVAHYMHRYWRSMDPTPFRIKPSAAEVKRFGPAIEFGYRVADEVLRRVWRLADENTVVIVASGLGQQPYVVDKYEGRKMVRVRSIKQVTDLMGVTGYCTPSAVMAPQWNLQFSDPAKLAQAEAFLRSAWVRDPGNRLFAFETVGNTINFNFSQKNLHPVDMEAICVFPTAEGRRLPLEEIGAAQDETPKEGYHDKPGVLMMRGAGVRKGNQIADCTNLDIAPTILYLLGLPIPNHMKGRVLHEALEDASPVTIASTAREPVEVDAA